jgi:hypothetical protein
VTCGLWLARGPTMPLAACPVPGGQAGMTAGWGSAVWVEARRNAGCMAVTEGAVWYPQWLLRVVGWQHGWAHRVPLSAEFGFRFAP